MGKSKLLIISLDAVSQSDLELLKKGPNFSKIIGDGSLVEGVSPIFVSNTYPIHTSVITGTYPFKHGIYDNIKPLPLNPNPSWFWYSKEIKVQTLYNQAASENLTTASILWPVTAGANIKYNIPEIFPTQPFENQAYLSLTNGNPLFTLKSILKHGAKMDGISQPGLDDFSCSVMCDTINEKFPDLMLIHFTDVDTNKHNFGVNSNEAKDAISRMDNRIGKLVTALENSNSNSDFHIIIFSDHGMTDVRNTFDPNAFLEKAGLIKYKKSGKVEDWMAWMKGCGGSAFCYLNPKYSSDHIDFEIKIKNLLETEFLNTESGFEKYVAADEFSLSGFSNECCLGVYAKSNCELLNNSEKPHKANHGYSIQDGKYNTFYLAAGPKLKKGFQTIGGSLLEIAPLASNLLGISLWEMDGIIRNELFE